MNPSDCFSGHWTRRAWKDLGSAEKLVQWYDYRRHFKSKLLYFLAVQPFVLCQLRAAGHLINLSSAWTSLKNPTALLAVRDFFVMHLCQIIGASPPKMFPPIIYNNTQYLCFRSALLNIVPLSPECCIFAIFHALTFEFYANLWQPSGAVICSLE